jgi:hypothetical protein
MTNFFFKARRCRAELLEVLVEAVLKSKKGNNEKAVNDFIEQNIKNQCISFYYKF